MTRDAGTPPLLQINQAIFGNGISWVHPVLGALPVWQFLRGGWPADGGIGDTRSCSGLTPVLFRKDVVQETDAHQFQAPIDMMRRSRKMQARFTNIPQNCDESTKQRGGNILGD